MNSIFDLVHTLINVDAATINSYAHALGHWFYAVLFAVIFAETGLVVTPFLPGDSLLFAVGAVAAHPDSPIQLGLVAVLLCIAAILGDAANYAIGRYAGPRVFSRPDSWLLNQKHLARAHQFYEDYGGVTIILARFMPIVRTFAPFVAGIGKMTYARFALYNVTGGVVWILIFLLGGWLFGSSEIVQRNFKLVIVAIVVISVLPAVFEVIRARFGPGRRQPLGAKADPAECEQPPAKDLDGKTEDGPPLTDRVGAGSIPRSW
jgi:membrane-associated protein